MAETPIETRMSARSWGLLIALALVWGGAFAFTGVAVRELPVLTIVALRVGLAALTLWLAFAVMGLRAPRGAKLWGAFLVMGLINNAIPFGLLVWGQTQIASGLAAILNATTPIFGALAAHALTVDEKLTGRRLAGTALGVAGVAILVGPEALAGLGGGSGGALPAQLACLGAALSYGVASVYGRRFRRMGVAPASAAAGQLTGSTLILLPAALIVDAPWTLPAPGAETVAAVAALAVLSTAFAYILYFRLIAAAGASNTMLVTLLVPVSAIGLGALLLGESLAPRAYAGLGLIGLGLIVIDGRALALLTPPRSRRTPG